MSDLTIMSVVEMNLKSALEAYHAERNALKYELAAVKKERELIAIQYTQAINIKNATLDRVQDHMRSLNQRLKATLATEEQKSDLKKERDALERELNDLKIEHNRLKSVFEEVSSAVRSERQSRQVQPSIDFSKLNVSTGEKKKLRSRAASDDPRTVKKILSRGDNHSEMFTTIL